MLSIPRKSPAIAGMPRATIPTATPIKEYWSILRAPSSNPFAPSIIIFQAAQTPKITERMRVKKSHQVAIEQTKPMTPLSGPPTVVILAVIPLMGGCRTAFAVFARWSKKRAEKIGRIGF